MSSDKCPICKQRVSPGKYFVEGHIFYHPEAEKALAKAELDLAELKKLAEGMARCLENECSYGFNGSYKLSYLEDYRKKYPRETGQ